MRKYNQTITNYLTKCSCNSFFKKIPNSARTTSLTEALDNIKVAISTQSVNCTFLTAFSIARFSFICWSYGISLRTSTTDLNFPFEFMATAIDVTEPPILIIKC